MNDSEKSPHAVSDADDGPGIPMTASEVERVLKTHLAKEKDHPERALWDLARFYCQVEQPDTAIGCLRQLYEWATDAETQAGILLAMGRAREIAADYRGAIDYYARAFAMEPSQIRTWYLIHNNMGACFLRLKLFDEAESYCARAIRIDPQRPDAYRVLGFALQELGRLREAVQSLLHACRLNPADLRAYQQIETLLEKCPELRREFGEDAARCRATLAPQEPT